jgi:hypothetical protein
MQIDNVVFETLQDVSADLLARWTMRVTVQGKGLEVRALPLVVEVGEQRAQMLVPLFTEEGESAGVQGLLPEIPRNGDEVKVGYADGPLFGTGFEFSETQEA